MRLVDREPPSAREGDFAAPADDAARSAVVRRTVEEVGAVVRTHYFAAADRNDAAVAASWEAIERAIAADAAAAPWASTASGGLGWWRYVATGAVSAVAAAAVTLWAVDRPPSPSAPSVAATSITTSGEPPPLGAIAGPSVGTAAPAGVTPAVLVPAADRRLPVIEALDVASGSGTVITVEDPEGNAAIIWVSDDEQRDSL